ncbi:hypothetical protein G7B13_29640, partial [Klebsiella pneumoniae]|nr:hypothetical protein [Klebsiella pneumoniae]
HFRQAGATQATKLDPAGQLQPTAILASMGSASSPAAGRRDPYCAERTIHDLVGRPVTMVFGTFAKRAPPRRQNWTRLANSSRPPFSPAWAALP